MRRIVQLEESVINRIAAGEALFLGGSGDSRAGFVWELIFSLSREEGGENSSELRHAFFWGTKERRNAERTRCIFWRGLSPF